MRLHAQLRRMMIPTMLCAFVAAATLSSVALAQIRGDSGLPSGPGNPVARLRQQIDALTQQMATLARLGQDVDTLKQQIAALSSQVASLNSQVAGFSSRLAALETSGALGVYDANENRIGNVIGVQDNIPWVTVKAAGHVVALQVFPNQLVGAFLWYTGTSCTGEVYISGQVVSRGPNVFSVAAVQEPGGVVYAAEAGAQAQAVSVRSVLQQNGTCFTFSASFNQNVLPATQLMTLDDVFRRPYSIR